jgi:hypothetical protein
MCPGYLLWTRGVFKSSFARSLAGFAGYNTGLITIFRENSVNSRQLVILIILSFHT